MIELNKVRVFCLAKNHPTKANLFKIYLFTANEKNVTVEGKEFKNAKKLVFNYKEGAVKTKEVGAGVEAAFFFESTLTGNINCLLIFMEIIHSQSKQFLNIQKYCVNLLNIAQAIFVIEGACQKKVANEKAQVVKCTDPSNKALPLTNPFSINMPTAVEGVSEDKKYTTLCFQEPFVYF